MATILGGDTLVITPTLALAGDKVAKILGREDLQNMHVIHLNDMKTPEHK
jgi:superfamily II DNA helicase RecQ